MPTLTRSRNFPTCSCRRASASSASRAWHHTARPLSLPAAKRHRVNSRAKGELDLRPRSHGEHGGDVWRDGPGAGRVLLLRSRRGRKPLQLANGRSKVCRAHRPGSRGRDSERDPSQIDRQVRRGSDPLRGLQRGGCLDVVPTADPKALRERAGGQAQNLVLVLDDESARDLAGVIADIQKEAAAKAKMDRAFWTRVGVPDALLLEHLVKGDLPDHITKVKNAYAKTIAGGATEREQASVREHLQFLQAIIAKPDGRKTKILTALKELETAVTSNSTGGSAL